MNTLLCLVGEQPIANLLPILHLNPKEVLLIYTKKKRITEIAEALQLLIEEQAIAVRKYQLSSEFSIMDTYAELVNCVKQAGIKLSGINLTGGTKPMSIAALQLAQQQNTPIFYMESSGNQASQLYRSEFVNSQLSYEHIAQIPEEITLNQFIRAFGYQSTQKHPNDLLEIAVHAALVAMGKFEIETGVRVDAKGKTDIDFVLRYQNQVAMVEVKRVEWDSCAECKKKVKPKPKQALEQIVTISEQRIFGTYTSRFAILHCEYSKKSNVIDYEDFAAILNTTIIWLHDPHADGVLSAADQQRLQAGLFSALKI